MKRTVKKRVILSLLIAPAITAIAFFCWAKTLKTSLLEQYETNPSTAISDRDGNPLFLRPNGSGYYSQHLNAVPENIKKPLLAKEDRLFYWHPGINPGAIAKDLAARLGLGQRHGSSTITQQLAKILLGQENQRTLNNKIKEMAYAVSLEAFQNKENIFVEYINSIYFGNRLQGLLTASIAYFGTSPDKLSDARVFQLLAAISDPNGLNPARAKNIEQAKLLARNLKITIGDDFIDPAAAGDNLAAYYAKNAQTFELTGYINTPNCAGGQLTAIDNNINNKLRAIILANIEKLDTKKAKNAAAVIIKLPKNEILALAGSPDPTSAQNGYQINMLEEPRQIGSTIKPFIYLKAFEKGMRPYTLIDDREYKYPAGVGYSIYPENYDRSYHGLMTAHYALANSINVAAVLTLEFAGIDQFGKFIENDLGLAIQQDYQNYQMGVALGALETNLLDLAQAFTIFPNAGKLQNLKLFDNQNCNTEFSPPKNAQITQNSYPQMVNKILSDRVIAQDQFTTASALNLPATNYALKTGTSHDYTDSWVVGYTPDFLVAVWVGNADGSAMDGISGQLGAGRIWSDIMQMMLASNYNKKTPLDFSEIKKYKDGNNLQFGLKNDNYETAKNILSEQDNSLILKPHNGDIYRLEQNTRIVLRAKSEATWTINGENLGTAQELIYTPPTTGTYAIEAQTDSQKEKIYIEFVKK